MKYSIHKANLIKIFFTFIFPIVFYSIVHEKAYRVLYKDPLFYGIPFKDYSNSDSLINELSVPDYFNAILKEICQDRNNDYVKCTNIEINYEFKPENKQYREVVIFLFLNTLQNIEKKYYYSPVHHKIWYIGISSPCTTGYINNYLIPKEKHSVLCRSLLFDSFSNLNTSKECDKLTNISITLQNSDSFVTSWKYSSFCKNDETNQINYTINKSGSIH